MDETQAPSRDVTSLWDLSLPVSHIRIRLQLCHGRGPGGASCWPSPSRCRWGPLPLPGTGPDAGDVAVTACSSGRRTRKTVYLYLANRGTEEGRGRSVRLTACHCEGKGKPGGAPRAAGAARSSRAGGTRGSRTVKMPPPGCGAVSKRLTGRASGRKKRLETYGNVYKACEPGTGASARRNRARWQPAPERPPPARPVSGGWPRPPVCRRHTTVRSDRPAPRSHVTRHSRGTACTRAFLPIKRLWPSLRTPRSPRGPRPLRRAHLRQRQPRPAGPPRRGSREEVIWGHRLLTRVRAARFLFYSNSRVLKASVVGRRARRHFYSQSV